MTEKLETIVEHIRDYYRQLAAHYQGLAVGNGQSERVVLVLGHVKDHALKRAAILDEQLKKQPDYPDFLATWLKEKPHEPNSTLRLDSADPTANTTEYNMDDLTESVTKQLNKIVTIYRHLAELSHPESLQEFFGDLAQNEEAESKRLINGMQEFATL